MNNKIATIFFLLFSVLEIYSMKIIKVGSFYLSENKNDFLKKPVAFYVSDKKTILILDTGLPGIRIYNKRGEYIKSFGRKGIGPGEFLSPYLITGIENKIIVYDRKRKKLMFFKLLRKEKINLIKSLSFPYFATKMRMIDGEKILVSGVLYKNVKDKRFYYSLAIYDIKKTMFHYIVPSYRTYGIGSNANFNNFLMQKLLHISPAVIGDYQKGSYVVIPVIKLKITLKDKNKYITMIVKEKKFLAPKQNNKMENLIKSREFKKAVSLLRKKSYVEDMFFINNSKKIGLVVSYYNKKTDSKIYYFQSYTLKGKLINKIVLSNNYKSQLLKAIFYYKKDENILYILSVEEAGFSDLKFKIHKFKITD